MWWGGVPLVALIVDVVPDEEEIAVSALCHDAADAGHDVSPVPAQAVVSRFIALGDSCFDTFVLQT